MTQKKHIKCRNMMYTQQLSHMPIPIEELVNRIEALKPERYAYIIHDKDYDENGKATEPHIHVMLSFSNARSPQSVGKTLGDKPQYIELFTKNKENGFAYLVHRTEQAKNKFQYDVTSVTANFNYAAFIEEIKAKIAKTIRHNQVDMLLDMFKSGLINKAELETRLSGSEYGKVKHQIENIHSVLLRQEAERWRKEALKSGKNLTVIWLYGAAGTGKTSLAKQIVKNEKLSLFMSGSSKDMFQNYNAENAIIIDDLRPRTIHYEDLLRITDPYSIEYGINAPSRYFDKALACELIIITSPFSPRDYYFREIITAEQRRIDTFDQLKRRILLVLYMDMDYIYRADYNSRTEQYENNYASKKVNTVSEKARPKKKGERSEDIFEKIFERKEDKIEE